MGRSRGTVERRLEEAEVDEVVANLQHGMTDLLRGCIKADPSQLFGEWASKSNRLSKENIQEYLWALQPIARQSPSQPVHADSLFEVLNRLIPDQAEGRIWLLVYDLKSIMQQLGHIVFLECVFGNGTLQVSFTGRLTRKPRHARKVWRKARAPGEWPMWVRSSPGTLELFMTYASCAQEFEVETDEKDLEDSQAADTNQESSLAVNLLEPDLRAPMQLQRQRLPQNLPHSRRSVWALLRQKKLKKDLKPQSKVAAKKDSGTKKEIYGLTRLQLPWQLVELVIHAYLIRRICVPEFDFPPDLGCIEFFSGGWGSSQVAKAFEELGCRALAFDILRALIFGLSALLAMLAWARGCCFVLEQPLRSIMTALPSWQGVIGFFEEAGHPLKMNSLNMAAFRAGIVAYSGLTHFDFAEGSVSNALNELQQLWLKKPMAV
ncbi:unnamed protein product [Durusdinium trenchii]|uniref:Uncharacterized protein n=1 Tax=Durusdinium trenchii TaxID=1381693 RepID=A0ABP0RC57_9DINO